MLPATLKKDSVVMKFLCPKPDAEWWRAVVKNYEKVVDGPDVWIKINYVFGWHDWCLDSICFASFPKTWTHISLQFVMPWPTLDSFALGLLGHP